MQPVTINLQGEDIGSITFDQPENLLSANRTASGFQLYIPATLDLRSPQGSQPKVLVENLRATFSASGVEIGSGHCTAVVRAQTLRTPIRFMWDWTLPAIAYYEHLRAGREPEFSIAISGEIRYLSTCEGWIEIPSIAFRLSGQTVVRYSREVWTNTMRQLNLRDAVVVEIPFPSDPPNGWEPVWKALRDARDSFDTGGSTGWRNCLAHVRDALSEWQRLPNEKEDQGPGWKRPDPDELKARTKKERIDNIRWHLLQLANYAAHTRADEWTRDDALMALSTLSTLIAVRKP